MGIYIGIHI